MHFTFKNFKNTNMVLIKTHEMFIHHTLVVFRTHVLNAYLYAFYGFSST